MSRHPQPKRFKLSEISSQFEYEKAILLAWFGECVSNMRDRAGLDQKQLAKLLDVPQCWISQLENGSTDFRVSNILKLAALFKTDPRVWIPTKKELEHAAFIYGAWGVKRRGRGVLNRS